MATPWSSGTAEKRLRWRRTGQGWPLDGSQKRETREVTVKEPRAELFFLVHSTHRESPPTNKCVRVLVDVSLLDSRLDRMLKRKLRLAPSGNNEVEVLSARDHIHETEWIRILS